MLIRVCVLLTPPLCSHTYQMFEIYTVVHICLHHFDSICRAETFSTVAELQFLQSMIPFAFNCLQSRCHTLQQYTYPPDIAHTTAQPVSALPSTVTRERRTSHTLRSPVFRKQHSYQHWLRSAPTKTSRAYLPQTTLLSASVLPALLPATSPQPHSQQPTLFPAIIPTHSNTTLHKDQTRRTHQHKRSKTHRYQHQSYQNFSHKQRYITRGA